MPKKLFLALVAAGLVGGATLFTVFGQKLTVAEVAALMLSYFIVALLSLGIQRLNLRAGMQASPSGRNHSEGYADDEGPGRKQGVVKWFNVNKGFGFITQENGEDIFVHYRSIRGQGRKKLSDGQLVSYRVIDSDRGLQADDVSVIS